MKLEEMKKQNNGLEGIFCYITKENYDLLTEYGFKKWGFQYTEDIIYVIDKEDERNEFIPFGKEEMNNYREFIFIDNKPVFK